ncbi:Rhodanese-like protein [Violaceomyces palustris]|uniref:Rhodanese-like protein n=1 Tax=Violaceomyces palustris TaxID=1673888 RepID=A0ACD0NQM0_9BASI|nr:Rhodanese-like protein [Violaceomyces palustris]
MKPTSSLLRQSTLSLSRRGLTSSSARPAVVALAPIAVATPTSSSRHVIPFNTSFGLRTNQRLFTTTYRLQSQQKDRSWLDRGSMTYAELKPETQAPTGQITIIDVREPEEVAQGMVPSAVNVPLSKFESAFSGSGGDFVREFAFNRPAYDDKLVFYCRSGKRSQQALEFARKNGWWNSRNYEGSWLDWVQQEGARGQNGSEDF